MLKTKCEISGSHGSDYENHCLLDCDTVYIGTNVLEKHTASMIRIEYGGITFLKNVGTYQTTWGHNPEDGNFQ
jgi:hypothetical protein